MSTTDPKLERTEEERKRRAAEDAAAVARLAGGDEDALSILYDRYSGMLMALVQRIVRDPADSEEIVQRVFMQAWKQADRYDPARSSVSTWLVLIGRSRAIDLIRSRKVKDRTLEAVKQERKGQYTSNEGGERVWLQERREKLQGAMDDLPPEQREILEMAFFRGMTQREIAETTGIPLGTVKTRSLLAMKKMRVALRDEVKGLL